MRFGLDSCGFYLFFFGSVVVLRFSPQFNILKISAGVHFRKTQSQLTSSGCLQTFFSGGESGGDGYKVYSFE